MNEGSTSLKIKLFSRIILVPFVSFVLIREIVLNVIRIN